MTALQSCPARQAGQSVLLTSMQPSFLCGSTVQRMLHVVSQKGALVSFKVGHDALQNFGLVCMWKLGRFQVAFDSVTDLFWNFHILMETAIGLVDVRIDWAVDFAAGPTEQNVSNVVCRCGSFCCVIRSKALQ